MESVETLTTLKGLAGLGSSVLITVIVCYTMVKHILPFFERQINSVLQVHKESLTTITSFHDKVIEKIVGNMERGLTNLSTEIRDLRNEVRDRKEK